VVKFLQVSVFIGGKKNRRRKEENGGGNARYKIMEEINHKNTRRVIWLQK
jgi:hypothetical protein